MQPLDGAANERACGLHRHAGNFTRHHKRAAVADAGERVVKRFRRLKHALRTMAEWPPFLGNLSLLCLQGPPDFARWSECRRPCKKSWQPGALSSQPR